MNFACMTLFLLILKRYLYRNRPYRKAGIHNLGLRDGNSSFPAINLYVALSASYAIMCVHNRMPTC